MSPDWRPTIDVLVGTFNEESHLPHALDTILAQDYDPERITIWVLDGGSTDRTVAISEEYAARDPRLRIVTSPDRRMNLPESLNVGIERGEAELVAKIDGHGWPEPDFLASAVRAFDEAGPEAGCVGGRPTQYGETPFGNALADARGSKFGVGGSGYAATEQRGWVDTVQCGVYKRAALDEVGPFDPAMNYGEDEELNWRLLQAGHRIYVDTRINFHYITRPNWKSAYRQYRNYGRARIGVVAKYPNFLSVHHLAPSVAVAGMAGLAALSPVSKPARTLFGLAAGAYGAGTAAAAIQAVGVGDPVHTARVGSCFSALHAGYGVGMLQALRDGGVPHLITALRAR